jgi:hypothetical protein
MAQVWLAHSAQLPNLRQHYIVIVRRREGILGPLWGHLPGKRQSL